MTSELVLLLALSTIIMGSFANNFIKEDASFVKHAVPRMAIRLEKQVITGYQFSQEAAGNRGVPLAIGWEQEK